MPNQNNALLGQGQPGQFSNTGGLATIVVNRREFAVYLIADDELDTLTEGYTSLNLTFLGIAIGAIITLVLAFCGLQKGDWLRPWFGVGSLTAFLLGIYFGRCVYKERKKCNGRIAKIRATEVKTEVRFVVSDDIVASNSQDNKNEMKTAP